MKLHLKDQSGQEWTCFPTDDDDIIGWALSRAKDAGLPLNSLVLPNELPRRGQFDDPDWDSCIALFRSSGDTPEWRNLVRVQELRKALNDHL